MKAKDHKPKRMFYTTRMIVLGFFIGLVFGTGLLCLPFATAGGEAAKFTDALFTATSAICVTGLVTVNTFEHWSLFGQVVIALLLQFGGLGIITFITTMLMIFRRKITMKTRMLIQESYNLDTMQGMVKLVRRILKGTLLIEGIGALLYMIVFIPQYGPLGIWKAIFHSISAFCNGGMDVVGPDSLAAYRDNFLMNATTCMLIILGGIGFPVWWDILRVGKLQWEEHFGIRTFFRKLHLHSKLALTMTVLMVVGGAVMIFFIEYHNPLTLASLRLPQKIQAAFFQSVTLRTAGFFTIPQQNFTDGSTFLFLLWMFVGGSPSGTAGGVKTVSVLVLILAMRSISRDQSDVEVFRRCIPDQVVKKALAVVGIGISTLFVFIFALCITEDLAILDLVFEATSALGTVGLSRGVTAGLSSIGKYLIIFAMFLGRVGPISMALTFNRKSTGSLCHYPEEKITVG